jgi:hypothetical protein
MKRKMLRNLAGFFAAVSLVLFGFRAEGQTNRWINQGSGKWEVGPNWSLDLPPASQQFIFVTNAGSDLIISNNFPAKRVMIDAITATPQHSNTMTVTSLTLAGAGSSAGGNVVNWLSLTNAAVPLHVLTGVTMAQGSLLTVDSSAVGSSSLLVDGKLDIGAQAPPQFTANFPATLLVNSGFAQIGNLVLGSGSNLVGTLTLSRGTLVAANLGIGNNGTVNLGSGAGIATVNSGATLSVSSLTLGSLNGGRGSLQINSNATVNVLSDITLVTSSFTTTSSISISGGSFSATNGVIQVGPNGAGLFAISGGKHFIRQLKLGGPSANSTGHFVISGGTLKLLGDTSAAGNGLALVVNSADFEGGDVDGTGTSVTIGDNGHSANATMRGGSAVFNAMAVGHQSGYTGTYAQSAGTMIILSNLTVGADCPAGSAGAVGIATLSGGWLFVTNSDHNAVLDVRNGSFTLQSGGVLVVDNLVVTNDCGHFTNNGGIIIPGNSFYTGNLLLNPGAEDAVNPDLDPNDHLYPWTTSSASPPDVMEGFAHTGAWVFYGGTGAGLYGSLTQTVDLVDNQGITAAALDSGKLLANVIFWEQTVPDAANLGPNYDYAQVSLSFLDSKSNTMGTLLTSPLDAHVGYWSNYTAQHVIPPATRSLQYAIDFHSLHSSGVGDHIFEDDNLLFISAPPSPTLSVNKAGDNIVLSWPAWAANFDLQSSATLARPISWQTVTNIPVAAWGRFFVTNSISGAQYYRLRGKP